MKLTFSVFFATVNPCEMPFHEGVSAQFLDETFYMRDKNLLSFSGNAASTNACLKYLEEVDNHCSSKNATFNQAECENYCRKLFWIRLIKSQQAFDRA